MDDPAQTGYFPGMPKSTNVALCIFAVVVAATMSAKTRPTLAGDGFPTGKESPEGAAADFARIFINADTGNLRKVCVAPYGGEQVRAEYFKYLTGLSDYLEKIKKTPDPERPKRITKVFAARHFSKNGPASYGSAAFGFQDVMFVDLEVTVQHGEGFLKRTLVIKDQDGKWYAHPMPELSRLLSDGLYEESASVEPAP